MLFVVLPKCCIVRFVLCALSRVCVLCVLCRVLCVVCFAWCVLCKNRAYSLLCAAYRVLRVVWCVLWVGCVGCFVCILRVVLDAVSLKFIVLCGVWYMVRFVVFLCRHLSLSLAYEMCFCCSLVFCPCGAICVLIRARCLSCVLCILRRWP